MVEDDQCVWIFDSDIDLITKREVRVGLMTRCAGSVCVLLHGMNAVLSEGNLDYRDPVCTCSDPR
jgi:hypothetical protein